MTLSIFFILIGILFTWWSAKLFRKARVKYKNSADLSDQILNSFDYDMSRIMMVLSVLLTIFGFILLDYSIKWNM